MKKNLLWLASLVMMLLGLQTANAAVDLGTINLGQGYTIGWDDTTVTFVAPRDGVAILTFPNAPSIVASDGSSVSYTSTATGEWKFNVIQGVSYTITVWSWASDTLIVEMESEDGPTLTINEIEPAAGTALYAGSKTGDGKVSIYCGFIGSWEDSWITSGSLESIHKELPAEVYPSAVQSIRVAEPMIDLYDKGMKPGDALTLHVAGFKDQFGNLYNKTGEYTIDFTAGAVPFIMTDTTFPEEGPVLYSYYLPGDPKGIFSFTFNKPISGSYNGGPLVEYGITTENNQKLYSIPYTINGNVLTIDLTGVNYGDFNGLLNFDPQNLALPGLKLSGLYDTDGNMFVSLDEANAGSYDCVFDYELIEMADFTGYWTPADGKSIADGTTVSLIVSPGSVLHSFTSIKFADDKGHTAEVPMSNCNITTSGNSKTISCAVPAGMGQYSNVKVCLTGIVATDGYTYPDSTFEAVYNTSEDLTLMTFNPGPGVVTGLAEVGIVTNATFTGVYPTVSVSDNTQISVYVVDLYNSSEVVIGKKIIMNPPLSLDGSIGGWAVAKGTKVTIEIPARMFYDEATQSYSAAATLVYEINETATGIEAISIEGDTCPVFNLHGVKVLDNAKNIDNLSRGIYIIGGKKVVK